MQRFQATLLNSPRAETEGAGFKYTVKLWYKKCTVFVLASCCCNQTGTNSEN